MMHTGLVSITFRQFQPRKIVGLVKQAALDGIEWGGDVHVPHGDVQQAAEVFAMTEDAGLQVAAYGSYYNVGCEEKKESAVFEKVLESAIALQAPTIRVWAGNRGSREADADWWNRVLDDARRIAEMAAKAGIIVAFEYHQGTLTDTLESACRLLKNIDHPNMRTYWQPLKYAREEEHLQGQEHCLLELQEIVPWLSHLHVYHRLISREYRPLAEGEQEWLKYMEIVKKLPGERYGMIEFVKGGTSAQFLEDAETLKRICTCV
ncbi:MAG: TIM barrel protein [bacterium]|nr:TIM barrel protein [bacterium]